MLGLDLSPAGLLKSLMMLVPLVLSLTVHEWAHAWSAYKLGDDTASRMGRLTLNPLAHIDPIGTFLLPLLGVPFGWAKPVPVNPARFTRKVNMRTGMLITAAAGPFSNVVLAVASTVALGLFYRLSPGVFVGTPAVRVLLVVGIKMNVALALFNLLPVPPLDGSRVVDGLMPLQWRSGWEAFTRLSPFLLLAVMFYGGVIIAGPSDFANGLLQRLLVVVAGV